MTGTPRSLLTACAVLVLGCAEAGLTPSSAAGTPDPSVDRDLSDGLPFAPGDRIDVGDADLTIGAATGDIGSVVAMPGDLDADGFDDIVVGNEAQPGPMNCTDEACVSFSTTTLTIVYGGPSVDGDFRGRRAELRAWYGGQVAVAGAGDVDGDGHADLLVGVQGTSCAPGAVVLVYGGARLPGTGELRTAGPVIRDDSYCTGFGLPFGLGDLDGDGFDDFAVGARTTHAAETTGYLHVFYGGPERMTGRVSAQAAAGLRIRASDFHPRFGRAAAAGDVDGDGLDDFVVGRTREHAYLVRGAAARRTGVVSVESIGIPLATNDALTPQGLGDLDGDGMDEIGFGRGTGELAHVLYGRTTWAPLNVEEQAELRVRAGRGCILLAGGGDVDGDGHADLLCGASDHRNGAAVLAFGGPGRRTGELDLDAEGVWVLGRSLEGRLLTPDTHVGDATGHAVLGARDVNGDGLHDVLVGTPSPYRGGGIYAGSVHVFLGRAR